jgi:hypothetical protein
MSAKHTPGPWVFLEEGYTEEDGHAGQPLTVTWRSEDLCSIFSAEDSTVIIPREVAIANARLIAAAPELLAVLMKLRRGDLHQRVRPLFDEAQAAIAKATGEPS